MENTNKDVNQVINQMQIIKFKGVFMATWNLLMKEPLLLVALVLAPMLLNGILEGYVWPPLLTSIMSAGALTSAVVGILLKIVTALIAFFGSGLILRAASHVFDGKKINVAEIVAFVQKYFIDAIKLTIRLFIYTGSWLLIAYMLAIALLLPLAPAVSGVLVMLLPIAVIIYAIAFFKKIINSSLSFAIFWSAEKPEVGGSLKKSLELCDKLTWTIFGNYILIGLIGALASFVIVAVLAAVLVVLGNGGVAITSAIASGLVGTFYALFQYCLKGQVEKFRGPQRSAN